VHLGVLALLPVQPQSILICSQEGASALAVPQGLSWASPLNWGDSLLAWTAHTVASAHLRVVLRLMSTCFQILGVDAYSYILAAPRNAHH